MSERQKAVLDRIVVQHETVIRTLRTARKARPCDGDVGAIAEAVADLEEMYCLALVATTESFLRDFVGVGPTRSASLGTLLDRTFALLRRRGVSPRGLRDDWTVLRRARNSYAHGTGPANFPTIAEVRRTCERLVHHLPDQA